jgi:hypothetical protein
MSFLLCLVSIGLLLLAKQVYAKAGRNYKSILGSNANKAWRVPNADDEYPEVAGDSVDWHLKNKPSFGIALSGGGMRAASNALGWLQAFHDKGALAKARYVTVNSGASWVTLIAIFAASAKIQSAGKHVSFSDAIHDPLCKSGPVDLAEAQFLLRVRQGLRVAMAKNNREYAYLDTLHWVLGVTREAEDEREPSNRNFWCRAVEEFMAAHHQKDPEYIAVDDNFDAETKKQMPFFIVAGSIMLTKTKNYFFYPPKNNDYCLPFEFTPTYCGVPVFDKTPNSDTPAGFIEPFAFNCNYEKHNVVDANAENNDANKNELFMKRIDPQNKQLLFMSDVSGISSSAVAQGFFELVKGSQNLVTSLATSVLNIFGTLDGIMDEVIPKFHFWALKKNQKGGAYSLTGGEYKFSDGGMH